MALETPDAAGFIAGEFDEVDDQEKADPRRDDGDQRPRDQAGTALRAQGLSGSPAGQDEEGDDGTEPGEGGGE